MNKFLLLCCICISFAAPAQVSRTEIVKNKINRIRKVAVSIPAAEPYNNEIAYDTKGNDTAEYYNNELYRSSVYEYDGKNRVIKRIRYRKDGTEIDMGIYEYQPDGGYKITTTDKAFGMQDYAWFNRAGDYTKIQSPDGSKINYVYDAKGRLISTTSVPVGDDIAVTNKYEYDAKGKQSRQVTRGEYISVTTFTYLPNGLLDKSIATSKNEGEETKTTIKYTYTYRK